MIGQLEDPADPSKFEESSELISFLNKTIDELTALSKNITNVVSKQEIASVVSYKTGIPLGKIQSQEKQKLLEMEDILKRRVVGQDHAVKALAEAIVESRSGLNKPGQPIGSFFCLDQPVQGKRKSLNLLLIFYSMMKRL